MKIKTKLFLGFGTILLLIMILLGFLLNLFYRLNYNLTEMVVGRYERVRLANVIYYEVANMRIGLRELVLDQTGSYEAENLKLIVRSRENALSAVQNLAQKVSVNESIEIVGRLQRAFEQYIIAEQAIIELAVTGRKEEATELLLSGSKEVRKSLYSTIDELIDYQEFKMDAELKYSSDIYQLALNIIISSVFVFFLAGTAITFWVTRNISRSINKVTAVITSVASKKAADGLPRIKVISRDEIGDIALAFNRMAQALEEHARSEQDINRKMQEQNWMERKIAEIAMLYQGVQDLQILGQLFINKITPIVGARYGVIYTTAEEEGEQYLKKLAGYAADNQEVGLSSFSIGEGLIGQCALENNTISLTEIPDDYIKIKSGLGMAGPAHVLILPVEFEGKVLAVVELASFKTFNEIQQELLQKVLVNLGITLNTIGHHLQVKELLVESQVLTEELQNQSEELQLQQEELRSINEKLEEENKNSENKTKELERIKDSLEEKAKQLVLNSKYKSEFLANMSHELRTPLNSLLILAQMLVENKHHNLTPKQVEYASTIYASGNELLNLINDILELSKVEAGKMDISYEKVLISDVKKILERQFLPMARRQKIKFNIQIEDNVPKVIYTDEQRLQQILKNLLSNAFKFTEKGSVLLHIQQADKNLLAEEEGLKSADFVLAIAVSDTGIGIPVEKQNDVFEAFRQADGTTSRKYGGTGLGLAICREIAQLLGGCIKLDSVVGKGSTFTLYLPNDLNKLKNDVASEEAEAIAAKIDQENTFPQGEALLAGKKILIVDDDMRNVSALIAALEGQQMKVQFAENGQEGIETLQNNQDIDLVLMDIMMPELDGYEAIRQIRQIPRFQHLPIIALTAKAMKNDKNKCIAAGASDYISKPVNLEQLFSLMRVWLYR